MVGHNFDYFSEGFSSSDCSVDSFDYSSDNSGYHLGNWDYHFALGFGVG